MDYFAFRLEEIALSRLAGRELVTGFLADHGLCLDAGMEKYYGVFRGERLVGGAGYERNIIKCVAVASEFRGEGIVNALVSKIVTELRQRGCNNIFIFTKPDNAILFESLGFSQVEKTSDVLLLESDSKALQRYLDEFGQYQAGDGIGAIVMNCNPFTLGHRYLIETAAEQFSRLLIFAVQEEASVFPFDVRLRLMQEGTADLPGVTVIPGGEYVISAATFPTYFLGDTSGAARAHTELDITIFGKRIAPAAGIVHRFAGDEPYSIVTRMYNASMQRFLPPLGVAVSIIPRRELGGEVISASRVRTLLASARLEEVKRLVPETTYRFLTSPEAEPVVARIRAEA